MRCSRCGNEIPNGSVVCPNCGMPLEQPNLTNNGYGNNTYNNQNMPNNQQMINNNMPNNQSMMNNNQFMVNNDQPIPNNGVNYNNFYNQPKDNKKIAIIIIGSVVAIGIIVTLIVLLTGTKGSDPEDIEKDYRESVEKEKEEITSKISTTYTTLKNGDYLFIIQNNSNKPIYADCPVEFYNDSTLVATETAHGFNVISPGSKGYGYIRAYDLEKVTFNKVVPKATAEAYNSKTYDGKISYTAEKKEDYLAVSVTNNTGESLDYIDIVVLYYDASGAIIGYESEMVYNNLYVGSTNIAKVDYPTDSNYRDIEFNNYEIFVSASGKY